MPIPDNRTFWDHSRRAFVVHSADLSEDQTALKRPKTRPKNRVLNLARYLIA